MNLIEINDVSKSFEYDTKIGFFKSEKKTVTAIKNINFTISKPSIVTLIGANGAGKTTLIKMLLGLIAPTSGKLLVLDQNPYLKDDNYLKKVGFVSGQKRLLNPDLPAFDSIFVNSLFYGLSVAVIEERFKNLTKLFGIENKIDVPIRNLSLGETIKFEIISSIIHRPQIILLDEPTIGLDFEAQMTIIKTLKELHEKENITILLTSHYPKDIKELSQRLVVLEKSEIIFDGLPSELDKLNQNSEVSKYLNQLNEELKIYE